MHFTFRKRFLVLLTPLAALLAIMFLVGGGAKAIRTFATGPTPSPTPDLTGVSCANVYIDDGFPGVATFGKKDLNGDTVITDADITSMTMSRTEPSKTQSGKYDVTTVSYLGKPPAVALGALGALVPGGPPAPVSPTNMTCGASTLAAAASAEANRFGGLFEVPYSNQYGVRPTAIGTYTDIPAGNGHLTFSSCAFSESQALWVRIDSDTHITKTGKGSANDGVGTLYLGAGAPTAGLIDTNGDGFNDATTDGTNCATGGFAYHFVFTAYGRNARTDHWATSVGACGTDVACQENVTLGIAQDADGPNTPKVKGTDQSPDGTSETTKVADDWDGDGCPDWDELGRGYMQNVNPVTLTLAYPPVYVWATHPVNGMDPFNPYDCNINLNATISMTTTIGHNTSTASPYGNGSYSRCLGSFTDTKTKDGNNHRALSFRLGCYTDTTLTVINSSNPLAGGMANTTCPPAPTYMCGDGRSLSPPPGCVANPASATWCADATAGTCPVLPCPVARFAWTGIDPLTYPVVSFPGGSYYDTSDNTIHIGGCFAGFGGGSFGNVIGNSTIDAHTGAGSFQYYLNQTLADCNALTPQGAAINGTVTIVELRTEKGLTDAQKYDSDRDGCSDARELGVAGAQATGGFRDPYNPWDYFDPEKVQTPGTQPVADILKVISQFGKNQGNPAYTNTTDRTGVPGGKAWNLGAPDGQENVVDILIAIKQFGHSCPHVTP